MKQLKGTYLKTILFIFILFSLFTFDPGSVYAAKSDAPVLARVEVINMVDDLGLPVHAHLQDASGDDYALVIATQSQLQQAGVQFRILDKNAKAGKYYILSMFPRNEMVKTQGMDNVLMNDGKQAVIRSTWQKVKSLLDEDIDVHQLEETPLVFKKASQRPFSSAMAVDYNATINQMINLVTQAKVDTYINNLTGENPVNIGGSDYTIVSRHTSSGTPLEKATQYVYEFMQGEGLAVSYHNWSLSGYSGRNVIGEMTGTTQPNEIVLITAHLDNLPSGAVNYGADDNGSGSVGVMLCAEIMTNYQFNRTIRFVFFTGEEQGLLGSNVYADLVYANGDNVVAVYNMDMLAYDGTGGPDLRLHTRTTSNPGYDGDMVIANTFNDVLTAYGLDSVLNVIFDPDGITQSDHSPFWNNGYPAILGIEEHDNDMTPYYHTTGDRVSTLNMTYFTNFVKASVGTSAHLASLDDGTLIADFSGTPTSGGYPLNVNFTDLSIGATSWSWTFTGGTPGTSSAQNPAVVYNGAGTFDVSLTVYNATTSESITKTGYITVTPPQPPVADFSAGTMTPYIGQQVTFSDLTSNSPTSWSWTFPGGTPTSSTAQNPVVSYAAVGTYDVTLIATNSAGTDTETKTGYITVTDVPLVYCDSQGNNYSYEYIGNATVGDLDNTSAGSSYTDYTSLSANVTAGDNVSVSLTPVFTSTTYTEYWKIWIDYNIDGDFDDAGEEIFSASGTTTVTGNFSVPITASGSTRMRVSMKWNATQTACETFSYGEVEDYTINISGITIDPPVADFTASMTTINEGQSITFTDSSTNSPTSWSWTFTGGTPSGSTSQNPTVTYNTAGTYTVALTATNSAGSDTMTKIDYITVNVYVPDPPVANFTASSTTIVEGQSITFSDTSTNTPTSWSWSFTGGTPGSSTLQNPTITYNSAGTYSVTLTATNAGGSDVETKTDYITVDTGSTPILFEKGSLSGVSSSWQTVILTNTYTSPVVVCSNDLGSAGLPAVSRVRNATGNSFDVMVQNPSGTALSGYNVHYMVIEEGVYTNAVDGVTMEAVKVTSTATADNNSWTLEARSYQNTYSSPVIVGQVMTYNDAGWSVFWGSGSSRNAPPSANAFYAGKHVGEDPDNTRANETIGYIVIEQGSGTINGIPYSAALGADIVRGPGNTSTGYTYTFGSVANASTAIFSAAAMDGGNGGWPVMYGSSPLTSTSLTLVFDEDQMNDSERKHGTEQVAYIVFGL
jgi:PKD repeat protein